MMTSLRDVSHVGEYTGDGRGDASEDDSHIDADPGDENLQNSGRDDDDDDGSLVVDDSRPLLVLFDCETTGLSIYADHITDIGAKVMNSPVPLEQATFCSLVRTGRNISSTGN